MYSSLMVFGGSCPGYDRKWLTWDGMHEGGCWPGNRSRATVVLWCCGPNDWNTWQLCCIVVLVSFHVHELMLQWTSDWRHIVHIHLIVFVFAGYLHDGLSLQATHLVTGSASQFSCPSFQLMSCLKKKPSMATSSRFASSMDCIMPPKLPGFAFWM